MTHCQLKDLKNSLNACLKFLKEYDYLSDLYIIEFFTEKHWAKLPKSWQNVLSDVDAPELAEKLFISRSDRLNLNGTVWPLSLLCFRKCASILPLPRNPSRCSENNKVDFKQIFQKHTTPKKRHEIAALSKKIKQVYSEQDCTSVIDVGSGQGHLSRLLCLNYNLPVVALEHEVELVKRARKFDLEAASNFNCPDGDCLPIHIPFTVLPDVDKEDFVQILKRYDDSSRDTSRCLLTGLHACGDLSATMIRLFIESRSIHSLVSVACCYIKLTTDSDDPGKEFRFKPCASNRICYPMSAYTRRIAHHQLSYRALKLACHGLENLISTLRNNEPRLKVQCYRAVLEHMIRKKRPELKRPAVKTIRNAHLLPFSEYAKVAFTRLDFDPPNDADFDEDEIEAMLKQQNQVITIFTLAFMLGPVIESVILLDRVIYLAENGISSSIKSVFDPALSPRCFAIIASKPRYH